MTKGWTKMEGILGIKKADWKVLKPTIHPLLVNLLDPVNHQYNNGFLILFL